MIKSIGDAASLLVQATPAQTSTTPRPRVPASIKAMQEAVDKLVAEARALNKWTLTAPNGLVWVGEDPMQLAALVCGSHQHTVWGFPVGRDLADDFDKKSKT